jgi:hypothetical protein
MSYYEDVKHLRRAPVEDAALRFTRRPATAAPLSDDAALEVGA